ncbi:hypothetical protein [Streptomyces sp. NPDC015131]|uniref:hypothetical protein n=1 Tax=Streptomyces sp. NPDC015131 TaxID=3364941 RepID=UPI0036FBA197
MAISFVSQAGTSETTSDTSYTLTKPASIQADDLLIGVLALYPGDSGSQVTVNVPSGWTLVRTTYRSGSNPHQVTVMKKTATGSEPSTWSGSLGSSETIKMSLVAAYRGADAAADQFVAEGGGTGAQDGFSMSTATVNNTDSSAWRVTVAGATSADAGLGGASFTSNETSQRRNTSQESGVLRLNLALWDSNGAVSTGNTSRTIDRTWSWTAAANWIGLIKPANTAPPSSGSIAVEAPGPTAAASGTVTVQGALAATAPAPAAVVSGYHEIPADGSIAATAPVPVSDITAGVPVTGSMAVSLMPTVAIAAETRVFGDHVLVIDPESRTVVVIND